MPDALAVERHNLGGYLRYGDRRYYIIPGVFKTLVRLILQPECPVHVQVLLRAIYPDGFATAALPRKHIQQQIYLARLALAAVGWPGTIKFVYKRGYYLHAQPQETNS